MVGVLPKEGMDLPVRTTALVNFVVALYPIVKDAHSIEP